MLSTMVLSPHSLVVGGGSIRAPVMPRIGGPLTMADKVPHVAVVGAGWGGWGAAKALIENGCKVTLLDALPDPTGATPYLTPTGKPFEAGTRGFWYDYPNINGLVKDLGLREEEVFTDYTNSSFYSPDGLEATAPVFSKGVELFGRKIPELPSPLGQVAATVSLFERIPVLDRVTMIGLLLATIDFTRDEKTMAAYDRMSAHQLFIKMGISPRLVADFIRPTLLVGLFKPPEELSAAVSMELLYFYALAHQTSFDVRWIRSRSISELIIAPLARSLAEVKLPPTEAEKTQAAEATEAAAAAAAMAAVGEPGSAPLEGEESADDEKAAEAEAELEDLPAAYDAEMAAEAMEQALAAEAAMEVAEEEGQKALTVLGGAFVESLTMDESRTSVTGLVYKDARTGVSTRLDDLDACVLSLGSKGMKAVMRGSPSLARASPELCAAASLDSIDVIAVRLWLNETVRTRTPANVFSKFEALRGAGGTFFMLDQLQNDDPQLLWGDDEVQGSVLACDFYNAGGLLPLSDEEIVRTLMKDLLPSAVPAFQHTEVVDSFVARYPGAVTWFSPGSYAKRPPLQTSVRNLVCAGDWVKMGEREHGAKGLCQERAFVSGLEAANALARDGQLGVGHGKQALVVPIRDDEPQVVAGRKANKAVADALNKLGLDPSPWVR